MALILEFPPPAPTEPPAFGRIRRLSRPLEWLFAGLLGLGAILLAVAVVAVLVYAGTRLQVRPGGMQIFIDAQAPALHPGWTTVGSLPVIQKLALATSASLMMIPALAVLWQLRRLFGLYSAGRVLLPENARCMTTIALWLIAYAVAPTLGHIVVTLAGFDDEGWLRMDSVKALGLGLILFVVARVMAWAAEVHDDASRFV
ncbi:DUF2975 domain-containing protein [Brevundimonas sp. TWP2-3-4b1]|uniref:DUF2975 domain-containing protein n=1 Tax=Brevundimonas sp. TWP2-3-4b1 TaxID=2804580 RepID=UPI003CFAC8C9